MKRKLSIAAGLAVSAALLWAASRQVDPGRLAAVYSGARPMLLLPLLFTVAAELAIRGVKWKVLLSPAGPVRLWDALRLETAALALNNVLPLRLGELARGAYGAEFFGLPLATVFATILAEKALDLAALLAIASGVAAAGVAGAAFPRALVPALLVIAAAGLLLLRSAGRRKDSRLGRTLARLRLGLEAVASPASAAALFSLAVLQWFFNALGYYFTALALGLGPQIGVARSLAMSVTGAAASSVPGMPGYFGSVELALTSLLKAWGLPPDISFACAAAAHMASYLLITAAGLIFIAGLGRSPGEVWRRFSAQGKDR